MKFRSGLVLLFLVVLFAAPGFFAYFFYSHPHWLDHTKTNRGELINPPIQLMSANSTKWKLLLWSPQVCEESCIEQLDKLARIRLALGRRLYGLELWLLLGNNAPNLSKMFSDTLHEKDIRVLKLSALDLPSALPEDAKVYLENPNGYLVLSYPLTANPKDIFHDIKRLLKE